MNSNNLFAKSINMTDEKINIAIAEACGLFKIEQLRRTDKCNFVPALLHKENDFTF